jgi:hypothetical protein
MNPMQMLPREPVQSLGIEASYALNRRPENVSVEAIIVPELELCNAFCMSTSLINPLVTLLARGM